MRKHSNSHLAQTIPLRRSVVRPQPNLAAIEINVRPIPLTASTADFNLRLIRSTDGIRSLFNLARITQTDSGQPSNASGLRHGCRIEISVQKLHELKATDKQYRIAVSTHHPYQQHRCKNVLTFFYSCHVFYVFNVFFYFPYVFK